MNNLRKIYSILCLTLLTLAVILFFIKGIHFEKFIVLPVMLLSFPLGSIVGIGLIRILEFTNPVMVLVESLIMLSTGYFQWFVLVPTVNSKFRQFKKIKHYLQIRNAIMALSLGVLIGVVGEKIVGRDPQIKKFIDAPKHIFSGWRFNGNGPDGIDMDFSDAHGEEIRLVLDLLKSGEVVVVRVQANKSVVVFEVEKRLDYWLRVKPLSNDFYNSIVDIYGSN